MSTHFVGTYVHDITESVIAAVVAKQHTLLIGAPGTGKTTIARNALGRMTDGRYSFTRLAMGTPPEKIEGAYDPAALLEGRLERVVDGTPYDSANRAIFLDEMTRGSDAINDLLLDVLDRQDVVYRPPVIGTANFIPNGERAEALRDRIALWTWVAPASFNAGDVAVANMNGGFPSLEDALPQWDIVAEVHAMSPGVRAQNAIREFLNDLQTIAEEQGRMPNHRSAAQWGQILYRMTALEYGQADFNAVSERAIKILRFAWPNMTEADLREWNELISAVVDILSTQIKTIMQESLKRFNAVTEVADPAKKQELTVDLGTYMVEQQTMLKRLADPDHPQVKEACATLNRWFALAAQGKKINDEI
jgi:MoxR-like ATPase